MTETATTSDETLSTIQIEVIGSAFASICDEMGETLVKTSYSPNIKERRDCTTGLFNGRGEFLAQAEHIPMHLGSLMGIIQAVIERYPIDTIRDGDSFVGNDPHTGGGTHLPDIVLVTPIFVDGGIVGWATNLAHHADYADRGGAHIFQEGLRIPAVRFLRDWQYVPEVMDMILTNMQVPAERVADFNAQVAANRVGVTRYRELCERYGVAVLDSAASELLDYTERKVRAGIATIPDGVYRFSDVWETSDVPDREWRIDLELTVGGDTLRFDFDAPPQAAANFNLVYTALLSTVYYAVQTVVGSGIPSNGGLGRAIEVNAPLGSIINCVSPAAVGGRVTLCQRVVDVIHGALAQAIPERLIAASNGACTGTQFSGIDPRSGEFYVYLETIGGGYGAGCLLDGLDGVHAHMTNTSNLPVESLEAEYPLRVEAYELVSHSGGEGRFRGGMGMHRRVRSLHDDCVFEVGVSRFRTRPWGLEGGTEGAPARYAINDVDLDGGNRFILDDGDVGSVFTAGAGGYGDPLLRDPELVRRDVREDRISTTTAKEVYGINLD